MLRDVAAAALLNREETFGPVAGLVRLETEAEALAMANDTRAGRASYVFTRDLDRAWRMGAGLHIQHRHGHQEQVSDLTFP